MQPLILHLIKILGRYTAILLAIPAVAITVSWFALLDSHLVAFLVLAPIVIPVFTGSFALLIGLLFSGEKAAKGPFVERSVAPGLWKMWDEMAPPVRGERRLLRLDDRLNASISERRRFLGLFGREIVMTVGLPLMAFLDKPLLKSVIAHEVGHAEMKHTAGLTRLAEFERSFETVFDFMPVETSLSGRVLYGSLGRISDWMKAEMKRLAWQAEFEADAVAARETRGSLAARAEAAIAGAIHFYEVEIVAPLEKVLVGAIAVPPSPVRQFIDRIDEIRDPARLAAAAAAAFVEPPDPEASHPPFSDRLKALGCAHVPEIGPLGPPSLAELVPEDLKDRILRDAEAEWERNISRYLNLH